MKTLNIGILSYAKQKERLFAIAKGKYTPGKSEPKIWFTSREALNHVLSNKNMELLEAISKHKPASIKVLAELTKRQESNISRDLKSLEKYKIITLSKTGRTKRPIFPFNKIITEHFMSDENRFHHSSHS
jgi:predicted transcriptional regulator